MGERALTPIYFSRLARSDSKSARARREDAGEITDVAGRSWQGLRLDGRGAREDPPQQERGRGGEESTRTGAPGQNARVELHVRLRNSHPAYIKPFDVFAKWDFPDAERLLKRLVAQELT